MYNYEIIKEKEQITHACTLFLHVYVFFVICSKDIHNRAIKVTSSTINQLLLLIVAVIIARVLYNEQINLTFVRIRKLTVQMAGAEFVGREESPKIYRNRGQTLIVRHERHVNFL